MATPSYPQNVTMKAITCFLVAHRVNHFYHVHTDADKAGGKVSVENLETIVSRLTQLYVVKRRLFFAGAAVRGNYELYKDRLIIRVRKGQSLEWERFTVVKELCHPLIDKPEEFLPDAEKLIKALLQFQGLDGETPPQVISERLAEMAALELLYPLEFREGDREKRKAGISIAQIGLDRGVPPVWVERAQSQKLLDSCRTMWSLIPPISAGEALPPPLPPKDYR